MKIVTFEDLLNGLQVIEKPIEVTDAEIQEKMNIIFPNEKLESWEQETSKGIKEILKSYRKEN